MLRNLSMGHFARQSSSFSEVPPIAKSDVSKLGGSQRRRRQLAITLLSAKAERFWEAGYCDYETVVMETGVLEDTVGDLLSHTPRSIACQRYVEPYFVALRPAVAKVCEVLFAMKRHLAASRTALFWCGNGRRAI